MAPAGFSLIVASCDMEKYIAECLESLAAQNYDPSFFEIVCVDDGSTDSSAQVIAGYQKKYKNFISIQTHNSGLEKTCNLGIRAARFPWIVRVDADDMADRNLLKALNQAMQEHPGFDFYYCQKYVEYYSAEESYSKSLPFFDREEIFQRGDFFATGTAYRRGDLLEIGGFPDEEKNCGLENYSVILNLITRGKKGFAVEGASFHYRRHKTNMSTVKRQSLIQYGKKLLRHYGRCFVTNQYHPYRLILSGQDEGALDFQAEERK